MDHTRGSGGSFPRNIPPHTPDSLARDLESDSLDLEIETRGGDRGVPPGGGITSHLTTHRCP